MPSYTFRCQQCDKNFTQVLPMSQCTSKPECACGSRKVERDYVAEHDGFKHRPGTWPMKSEAAGCHPEQVREAYKASVDAGCPTEFTSDGRAVFTSARHRKNYCEKFGFYDRNGGYSDPQRQRRS